MNECDIQSRSVIWLALLCELVVDYTPTDECDCIVLPDPSYSILPELTITEFQIKKKV